MMHRLTRIDDLAMLRSGDLIIVRDFMKHVINTAPDHLRLYLGYDADYDEHIALFPGNKIAILSSYCAYYWVIIDDP